MHFNHFQYILEFLHFSYWAMLQSSLLIQAAVLPSIETNIHLGVAYQWCISFVFNPKGVLCLTWPENKVSQNQGSKLAITK